MNFSEAVRLAKPSDYIVGNQRRMFKMDGDVLKAADAVEFKKNGTIPTKFELATPDLSELVDLSWEVTSKEVFDRTLCNELKIELNKYQLVANHSRMLAMHLSGNKNKAELNKLLESLNVTIQSAKNIKAIAKKLNNL